MTNLIVFVLGLILLAVGIGWTNIPAAFCTVGVILMLCVVAAVGLDFFIIKKPKPPKERQK